MPRKVLIASLCLLAWSLTATNSLQAADIPTPASILGHTVGADRKLATYPQVLDYLRLVDAASDRVSIETAGRSTLDNEMMTVVLTSEENQKHLERYREIAGLLANPDRLAAGEATRLVDEGKVILLVTCTIHSTEVGCTQMATEFVHEFATTDDPDKLEWMDDVVMLLMPSINPDGQIMIVDWYNQWLGTQYEGGRMPWLYHHYVGHDNNRDYYMLTQKETKVVNDVLYHRWFPQVFVDEHQMGTTGPRMFVPPQTDPLAPEVHPLIFRQADLIGTNMSFRLESAGKTGVGHNMIFDSYWPGGTRNTAWWKNVTGLLTEVASARIATPVYVDPGELKGGSKGFPEYGRRANFPSVWEGGWWRLRDIVEYELVATWAAIETSSRYRGEILGNFHRMGAEAVEAGRSEPPYAWIIPPKQHDPVVAGKMVELLLEHGVRVERTVEPLKIGLTTYPVGTHVIPADQPYRAFALTMLRPQRYPEVLPYEDGPVIPPYDVTSWSLPVSMGVDIVEVETPLVDGGELEEIDVPVWPELEVVAGPGGHLVPHSADTAPILVNRLLADRGSVYWLGKEVAGGTIGDIWLPPGEVEVEVLQGMADELHLPIYPLMGRPEGEHWELSPVKVGLYKPWLASMDEGWTRWLLEQYEFDFMNLTNADIKEGSFANKVDVLLFPDVGSTVIAKGEPDSPWAQARWAPMPPEFAGGLEPEGGARIKEWVEGGGTVVALDSSGPYFIELFGLPVTNAAEKLERGAIKAPGTMLRILVDTEHPLGFGLRDEEAAYFAGSPVYSTKVPDPRFDRRVLARYPDHEADVPVSGYIEGAEHLERKAAAVELTVGEGKVVLLGFRAQHRGQPHRTFGLLLNALQHPR